MNLKQRLGNLLKLILIFVLNNIIVNIIQIFIT